MKKEKDKPTQSLLVFLERYDKVLRRDKPIRKPSTKTDKNLFEEFYDIEIKKYMNERT